ncbi:hypothetical protein R5R35_012975 [Gryllus longicercus]|uniref:Uncharacterized protein n=1 Tax=Gryllus longicercus TaxID=2509291 RepID=A0AAN9ZIG3_9ORTH
MSCVGKGLTDLPSGHWPSVMFLDVSSNAIANIDDLGRRFPSLNVLRMRHNALTALHLDAVAGPSAPNRLMVADLSGNRISHVLPPLPGARLNQFSTLLLSSNQIASLDRDTFKALPNFKQLSLNDNPLVIPPAQPFLSHHLLNELDLSDMDASALSEHTFSELPSLSGLVMERSKIRDVNGAFNNLQGLAILRLPSNEITEIRPSTFQSSLELSELVLERNPLVRLVPQALPVQSGGELAIDDTPLSCACAHAEVARWAAEHRVKLSATCQGASDCLFDEA